MTSAISSRALEDGPRPCDWLDGEEGKLGPARVPASHLASRARKKEPRTRGTCGQPSLGLFEPVTLQSLLASKLGLRLGTGGSTEYSQTWKRKATPAGTTYWELIASGHPTSGNDSTGGRTTQGWRTPDAPTTGGPRTHTTSQGRGHQVCLEEQAHMAVPLSGWGTPRVTTNGGTPCPESTGKGSRLEDQASLADLGFGTPAGPTPASTGRSGGYQSPLKLNPYFSGWLMGFPASWTICGQRAASLFARKSRGGSCYSRGMVTP